MSTTHQPFSHMLGDAIRRAHASVVQLHALTDIPLETIKNWLDGRALRPRRWQDVIKLAAALHLTVRETNELLHAARHPPFHTLPLNELADSYPDLLARWYAGRHIQGLGGVGSRVDGGVLSAAQALLATVPTQALPPIAPLPPGSRMFLTPNPCFVGRAEALLAVARALVRQPASGMGAVAAATGLGGIGKTQLATEFVHRYGQFFAGGVFWLSFADPSAVAGEVAACAGSAHLDLHPNVAQLAPDDQVALVRAAWQSPLPRLLIFDTCEDEHLLARWRPACGGCRILITSRRALWDSTMQVHILPLDVLPRADSIALLRQHRPDLSPSLDVLDEIAAELGDLPLALHLAGAYLARYRSDLTPTEYVAQLRQPTLLRHPSLRGQRVSPTGHVQHVARTFALSYERLDPTDADDQVARRLLAGAACFAPGEAIPRPLLRSTLQHTAEAISPLDAAAALDRLIDLGLLEAVGRDALRMHRLLRLFIRQQQTDPQAQAAVEEALLAFAAPVNAASELAPLVGIQRHLRSVVDAAIERRDARAADLCEALGHHLWLRSDAEAARHYLEQTLAIREDGKLRSVEQLADSCNLLGLIHHMRGDFPRARHFMQRALALWEAHLPPDHPHIAVAHENLGVLLSLLAEDDAAHAHLRHAFRLHRRRWGYRAPQTARALANLGSFFLEQGRYRRARLYLTRALAIREQVLPPSHMSTAQTLSSLGDLRYAQGHYAEASSYYERALAMRLAVFGPQHPDVAESWASQGRVALALGDIDRARDLLEAALDLQVATLGPDHVEVAARLDGLGLAYLAQGDAATARSYVERGLQVRAHRYGPQHPFTARSLRSLSRCALAERHSAEAQALIERAIAIQRHTLDAAHPDLASSLLLLGEMLHDQGLPEQALAVTRQAAAIAERRLGLRHPLTQQVQSHLSILQPAGSH
ncbi:MAG TPA: FxSxx-COOH system tetratricopeptide repeat protein [Herpetosiphonaceae bacterium]